MLPKFRARTRQFESSNFRIPEPFAKTILCLTGEFAYIEEDRSGALKAQLQFNYRMLDCLELIRLATVTDEDFSKLWEGSNEPFFAATHLIYGRFEGIQEFQMIILAAPLNGIFFLSASAIYRGNSSD